jgi:hypothetical protein
LAFFPIAFAAEVLSDWLALPVYLFESYSNYFVSNDNWLLFDSGTEVELA